MVGKTDSIHDNDNYFNDGGDDEDCYADYEDIRDDFDDDDDAVVV